MTGRLAADEVAVHRDLIIRVVPIWIWQSHKATELDYTVTVRAGPRCWANLFGLLRVAYRSEPDDFDFDRRIRIGWALLPPPPEPEDG